MSNLIESVFSVFCVLAAFLSNKILIIFIENKELYKDLIKPKMYMLCYNKTIEIFS